MCDVNCIGSSVIYGFIRRCVDGLFVYLTAVVICLLQVDIINLKKRFTFYIFENYYLSETPV